MNSSINVSENVDSYDFFFCCLVVNPDQFSSAAKNVNNTIDKKNANQYIYTKNIFSFEMQNALQPKSKT